MSKGSSLLVHLEEMSLSRNVIIYTTLINGCCKNGDIELEKKLFREMGEVGLVANRHAYTALMYGLFRKGVKKGGFELREEISRSSVLPNLI